MSSELFIGLISGTSMDAVDCALVDFSRGRPELVEFLNLPLPGDLKRKLLALCGERDDHIRALGEADVEVGRLFARAVRELLERRGLPPGKIAAIGSHGQTVRHQPPGQGNDRLPFTLQIGDPNIICELSGIATVADFRRRDMAAGGQGAPLVPAFHREVFFSPGLDRIILNIGGMANITVLAGQDAAAAPAHDTGPGNVLLDIWAERHMGRPYDDGGAWAASGRPDEALLEALLDEDYFRLPAPKSTGRELFNGEWLDARLAVFGAEPRPEDVQATLQELTARSIADEVRQVSQGGELIICGGGARNTGLLRSLAAKLPGFSLFPSTDFGIEADSVEAVAFAWFARKALAGEAIDLSLITGARHPNILGGIYQP